MWAAPATHEDSSALMRSAAAARTACVGPQVGMSVELVSVMPVQAGLTLSWVASDTHAVSRVSDA